MFHILHLYSRKALRNSLLAQTPAPHMAADTERRKKLAKVPGKRALAQCLRFKADTLPLKWFARVQCNLH